MINHIEEIPVGSSYRIFAINDASEWAPSLRKLGFREGLEIERLSSHDPVLVRCGNCKVAVCRRMLDGLAVAPCNTEWPPECCRKEIADSWFEQRQAGPSFDNEEQPDTSPGGVPHARQPFCMRRIFRAMVARNCPCHHFVKNQAFPGKS